MSNALLRSIRALAEWQAADPASAAASARAMELLSAMEEAARPGPLGESDAAAAHGLLAATGQQAFLACLGREGGLDRWPEAVFGLLQISRFSLLNLFRTRAAAHPGKVLFQDMSAPLPPQWSYDQIGRMTRVMAGALYAQAAEIGAPPRVAIFSDNRIEGACADLACLFYDILDAPLNTYFNRENLVEIFDRLGINIALTDTRERCRLLESVREKTAVPFKIFVLRPDAAADRSGAAFFGELCLNMGEAEIAKGLGARRRFAPNEVATVMFTSGSTGRPKGVSFSIYNLVAKRFARAAALPAVGRDEVFLSFLPLFHTFGRYLEMLGAIYWGGTYVFAGNASADTLFSLFPKVQPTGFISVPIRWSQLHERCLEKADAAAPGDSEERILRSVVGPRLRWGLSAAGHLDAKVFRYFERHGIAAASGFGMTEGTGGITMTPPGHYEDNTQGLPLPGLRARLGPGGELQVSGHYVARYLEDKGPGDVIPYPENPDTDYWLPTGDVFQVLPNGYFRIVDRIKDIYKNNRGETVAPLKVESKFAGVPGFKRVFLVGDGRPFNVLFLVPDRGDEVLKSGLDAENERAYYRRLVTAANVDLAPPERVVNFAVLDRDFEAGRGELTPKGSINRKAVEANFAREIEELYRKKYVELSEGAARVRIPLWLYRDLGILDDGISYDGRALRDAHRAVALPLVRDPGSLTWLVGDLEYQVRGNVLDLGLFARQPRLWMGNPALVRFCPCREGWDVPLEKVSDEVRLPARRIGSLERDDISVPALDPDRIEDRRTAAVGALLGSALFAETKAAAVALEEIEKIFAEPELRTVPVIRRRLQALARHPDESIRCTAYRILLLDEPNPEYGAALREFLHSGLTFLNRESIEAIASSPFGQGRFDALRQRMAAYREELDWPACDVTRTQFLQIFELFVDFAGYHPEFFGSVRAELAGWALLQADPELARAAEARFDELERNHERSLAAGAAELSAAEWDARLVFDDGLTVEEKGRLTAILRDRTFLKKSIGLIYEADDFQVSDIVPEGIWVSRLFSADGRPSFRTLVGAKPGHLYDLRIELGDAPGSPAAGASALACTPAPAGVPGFARGSASAVLARGYKPRASGEPKARPMTEERESVYWHLAIAHFPQGATILPEIGSVRPDLGARSLQYCGELDLWEKIRQFSGARGPEAPFPAPHQWRKLFIGGISAFFRAWEYGGRRIVPGVPAPGNVTVPETDFREEPIIRSLAGWRPYEGPLSLIKPLVVNFFRKPAAHYPWIRGQIDLAWVFDACYEALGYAKASAFFAALRDALAGEPLAGPGGASVAEALAAYLAEFEKNFMIPLPALNAIGRYKEWAVRHAAADPAQRERMVLDVHGLYRLARYPDVARYYLYRHTYFAVAGEKTLAVFDKLIARMSERLGTPAVQFVELSELQAALVRDEDRAVFGKMVFPRIRTSQTLDILEFGDAGAKQVIVRSSIADRRGEAFTFRETYDPAEIGALYRLFFKENYPKTISEQDRHHILQDGAERIVGGLCHRMMFENAAFIDGIVVASPHQGAGLAGAMIEDFCGRMALAGVHVVLTPFYLPDLFLRAGFKVDKRWGAMVRYV